MVHSLLEGVCIVSHDPVDILIFSQVSSALPPQDGLLLTLEESVPFKQVL